MNALKHKKPRRRPGRKGGEPITSPRRLRARSKGIQALELRLTGKAYREIAAAVGYGSAQAAWEAVKAELDRQAQEPAAELRKVEVERLDKLFTVAYPMALATLKDPKADQKLAMQAVDRCLRIQERRARLLGLDAPMIFDWRREAKEKGLPAAEQFEQMVGEFYEQIRTSEK